MVVLFYIYLHQNYYFYEHFGFDHIDKCFGCGCIVKIGKIVLDGRR